MRITNRARRAVSRLNGFDPARDWGELCLFVGGQSAEIELSAAQLSAIIWALGLDEEEPYPDDVLELMLSNYMEG